MRHLKIPLTVVAIVLAIIALAPEAAWSQECGPDPSPFDYLRIPDVSVPPGSRLRLPINIQNVNDIAGFQVYIEYDSTYLEPVFWYIDTFINTTIIYDPDSGEPIDTIVDTFTTDVYETDTTGGRFIMYTDPFTQEPVTRYDINLAEEIDQPATSGPYKRLALSVTSLFLDIVAIDSGNGTALYIPFDVSPDAPETSVRVGFYSYPVLVNGEEVSCVYNRYAGFDADFNVVDRRFTLDEGQVTFDPNATGDPVINSFTANPTSLPSGGGSTALSWDVANATQITIRNQTTSTVIHTTTNLTGSINANLTSTTTYRLTATNATGSITADVTVNVGSVTNQPPTIQPVSGAPFTINQGETVTFQVTATDPNASDIITLSATSLPPNAMFSTVTGSSSVTGNFSFTPDFTQSGTVAATFLASDGQGGSNSLTVVINIIEILKDRLFTTSASGQHPVGGLPGKQAIYLPINMVTSQTVYGVQFDFLYDYTYFDVDSFVVTGRTAEYVVYDNIGQFPGEVLVLALGLENEPIVNVEDTTAILYAVMSIDSAAPPGDYPVYIENAWESVNPDPNFPGLEMEVDSGIIQVDRFGDVNVDRNINVADLVNIVAYIINNFDLNDRQFDAADVIINDTVNVFDLVGVINIIFGLPINTAPQLYFENEPALMALDYNDLSAGGSEMLVVNSELPTDIAAVEMEITYDPSLVTLGKPTATPSTSELTLRYKDDMSGKMKVLLYFGNPVNPNDLIRAGLAELVNIPILAKGELRVEDKPLKITQALLSTPSAAMVAVTGVDNPEPLPESFELSQNYPNPFNPTTTVEFSINHAQKIELTIYNVLGQQVRTLADGFFTAGSHKLEWDATDDSGSRVASGIYLYRLQVADGAKSKKMLFLK